MMVQHKSPSRVIFEIINTLFMIALMAACLLPVIHVFFASFSDAHWVMNQTGLIWRIKGFNFEGYKLVLANKDLLTGYLNTFIYVFGTMALGMFLTVITAYTVSRKDALFANAIMFFISFTMMFSGGMIASYIVTTKWLHMFDTRLVIILPMSLSAFNLILVRTAMLTVPASLEESAMLDGAGRFTILFKIVLPLIKATLATVVLYIVIGQWNSWFQASIYLRDRSKFPLQLILKEILITGDTTTTSVNASDYAGDTAIYKQLIKYCTIVISTVPIFIFYPFIQKYFEKGVMIGAIKG